MITQNNLHRWANTLCLLLVCLILLVTFYHQLSHHDLPCPLCLLQRLCFVGIGLGLCMNLGLGIRVSHYSLMLLAALLGLGIALSQIFLHVSPGDLGYGSPLLSLFLYTWPALGFAAIIGFIALALLFERGFDKNNTPPGGGLYLLMSFFLILILANGISTFLECGFFICRDNPVHYYLLDTTG